MMVMILLTVTLLAGDSNTRGAGHRATLGRAVDDARRIDGRGIGISLCARASVRSAWRSAQNWFQVPIPTAQFNTTQRTAGRAGLAGHRKRTVRRSERWSQLSSTSPEHRLPRLNPAIGKRARLSVDHLPQSRRQRTAEECRIVNSHKARHRASSNSNSQVNLVDDTAARAEARRRGVGSEDTPAQLR